jgi:NADH-quinone oxidoreductase subunit C
MNELKTETEVLNQLQASFSGEILEAKILGRNRIRIVIQSDSLLSILSSAKKDFGFEHLSAIAGIDMEEYFAVAYMLGSWVQGLMLEVYIRIDDLENPTLPSVTSLWETANWHEREIYDLFGFEITDHPDLKRILLPEEWDEMPHEDPHILHPLRKAYKQPQNPFHLTRSIDDRKGHIDIDKWRESIT